MASPTLRLGSIVPDFEADTTEGRIRFHDWIGSSWVMFFSHPGDFTPVCTTELADISHRAPQFLARNVKVIGISADALQEHYEWIEDIIEIGNKTAPTCVEYPIIADPDRSIAKMYEMLDEQDPSNVSEDGEMNTIRTVFFIDPKKTIRAMLNYPASVGRDFDEVLRVFDSLQAADKHPVSTPANWKKGDDVIIQPFVSNEEAKKLFPGYKTFNSYLRTTPLPSS
ncbi:peroxiredoxin [Phanerochaete sordida]|uniref:Peroxiredoxin n=1 Tax=Phanerochaete sordida TaxID=48140 RepID=A0A9P3L8W8_9APHY|nr:peroxiredoxin [Phanerochaete sordida]